MFPLQKGAYSASVYLISSHKMDINLCSNSSFLRLFRESESD